jgi:hypothetical protein
VVLGIYLQAGFPQECPNGWMTPQEKVVERLILDEPTCTPQIGNCTPRTCSAQNIACGPAGDGCGGALDCGTCTAPDTCGGGGTSYQCGHPGPTASCTPKTCADLGVECGPEGDGCGGLQQCGTCVAPETCGGGGAPGKCGGGHTVK